MENNFASGDRIVIVRSADGQDPLPHDVTGTVRRWNPHPQLRQLEVDWDVPALRRLLVLADDADAVRKI
ncbi:DUF4314 domain-containing protein [Streptomyces sp. NPDC048473]|uniref:DUF4314 domain-containing protein n=1 Tax=unclassified Streptomyces TaxID=2593676 RepID=UPI00371255EF